MSSTKDSYTNTLRSYCFDTHFRKPYCTGCALDLDWHRYINMDTEKDVNTWIVKLRRYAASKEETKVGNHARDSLDEIRKLQTGTALRDYLSDAETKSFSGLRWATQAFRSWNIETRTGNETSRALGNVTQSEVKQYILDSKLITAAGKRSVLWYVVYRFPQYTKLTIEEDKVTRLVLRRKRLGWREARIYKNTVRSSWKRVGDAKRGGSGECVG